jgi:hypothetical protein
VLDYLPMGFLDRAKKMAEQAQAKLDEAQYQFNAGQKQEQRSGPAVEYDQHGRPIAQAPDADTAPPHGDPLAPRPAPPSDAPDADRNHPSHEPPKLSGGDPLAG